MITRPAHQGPSARLIDIVNPKPGDERIPTEGEYRMAELDRTRNRKDRRARLAAARHDPDPWVFKARPEAAALFPHASWGRCVQCWVSPLYSVMEFDVVTAWGPVTHLAIRRHDAKPDIPWMHKQKIKTLLMGAERVAVEVFPAAAELTDSANMYHLFVLPEGFDLPFTI
jgi:hypothetical protein